MDTGMLHNTEVQSLNTVKSTECIYWVDRDLASDRHDI